MEFFEGLIRNALEASVLALLIYLTLKLWRASAPVRHLLWLLVLVKLLLPPVAWNPVCLSGACREALHLASAGQEVGGNSPLPAEMPELPFFEEEAVHLPPESGILWDDSVVEEAPEAVALPASAGVNSRSDPWGLMAFWLRAVCPLIGN